MKRGPCLQRSNQTHLNHLPATRVARAWIPIPSILVTLGVALLLATLVLLTVGTSPLSVYGHLLKGSIGSWQKIVQVLNVWIPLVLCATGLLYTFRINLWNIGIEGQVMIGAVFSTGVLRSEWFVGCPMSALFISMLAAMMGGGLWALFTGYLKTRGGVNEIFAGLGMNFLAQGLILWLIFGPWKRPGMASMSGTELFPPAVWLPTLLSYRLSILGLVLAIAAILVTTFLLRHTRIGLAINAIGRNPRASFLLGLRTDRYLLLTMMLAGCFAGLAGNIQVTGIYHRLIPAISCNYGYLALMVVMLSNYRILAATIIAFFFAGINVGSIQLPMALQLDSSFSGVLQGLMVLSAICFQGWRSKRRPSASRGGTP